MGNKIIVLGDTHFDSYSNGIDNENQYRNQIKLWKNQIFKELDKDQDIKAILQLGDFTSRRTTLSPFILHSIKEDIFDELEKRNIEFHSIVGNHDIYFSSNRDVYSLELFEKAYKNVHIHKNHKIVNFDSNNNFLLFPWICSEDEKIALQEIISNSDISIIFGHFEIKDFQLTKTMKDTHGFDKEIFKGIPVWSGHYHIKQKQDNIFYIGTPEQHDFGDFSEEKGYYILDTEILGYTFIENVSSSKHLKVYIDSEIKEICIDGLKKESIKQSLNKEFNFNIFNNHKLKIFLDKDNSFNKKVIEKISEHCFKYRVEINNEESITDSSEELKLDFDIIDSISSFIPESSDYQKTVFKEIYEKSKQEIKC